MSETHSVGQRISYDGALCTVRWIGDVPGTSGTWLGVEWDDQARGKHDGALKGVRYFTCLSKSSTAASFIRPTRRPDPSQSFLAALNEKYASDTGQYAGGPDAQIVIFGGGKVAQEMGFDKIRRQQSRLEDLKIVILDGMRIARARDEGEESIGGTCPSVVQLDMSRCLWEGLGGVVEVVGELPGLRKLALSGNRFKDITTEDNREDPQGALKGITELALEDTLLQWDEVCQVAGTCRSLTILNAGSNQLTTLPPVEYSSLSTTLTSLYLEYNDITTLSDLSSLTALTALRNVHLKGNNITTIPSPDTEAPIFPSSIQYLDLSYNSIQEWSFIDNLPHHFPGLNALRIAHNPVYDIRDDANATRALTSEDAHMFTIARIASLKSLNFSAISPSDRANAEMFYLSRIAKQLASVPEAGEDDVKLQHPRYAELCDIYGEPDVIRRDEVNPAFLEARLVAVTFCLVGSDVKKTSRIPKSFDVYSVKGIAGKLFGLEPLGLRLVWETGEWDPVAGFYEGDGDSSEDETDTDEIVPEQIDPQDKETEGKQGRWVKREVELRDGPRQLGYCVDGLDVTLRIEEV